LALGIITVAWDAVKMQGVAMHGLNNIISVRPAKMSEYGIHEGVRESPKDLLD